MDAKNIRRGRRKRRAKKPLLSVVYEYRDGPDSQDRFKQAVKMMLDAALEDNSRDSES